MERIETRAAAAIFTRHLFDHNFRISVDVESSSFEGERNLQSFQQRGVFGHIVVMVADPLGDPNHFAIRLFDYYADARRSRAAVRTTIDVGDETGQISRSSFSTMRQVRPRVKMNLMMSAPKGYAFVTLNSVENVVENQSLIF